MSSLLPQRSYADRKNNSPTKDTQDSEFFLLMAECKLQYILILEITLNIPTYEVRCHIVGDIESDVSMHVVETLLSPTGRNTDSVFQDEVMD